jgi:hypothetical protein
LTSSAHNSRRNIRDGCREALTCELVKAQSAVNLNSRKRPPTPDGEVDKARLDFERVGLSKIKLLTQNHVFSLKRGPRPERSDQRQPD